MKIRVLLWGFYAAALVASGGLSGIGSVVDINQGNGNQVSYGNLGLQTVFPSLNADSQPYTDKTGAYTSERSSGEPGNWASRTIVDNTPIGGVYASHINTPNVFVNGNFVPSKNYFNENYASYINSLNSLFLKYPDNREGILKIVISYGNYLEAQEERASRNYSSTDSRVIAPYDQNRIESFIQDTNSPNGASTKDYTQSYVKPTELSTPEVKDQNDTSKGQLNQNGSNPTFSNNFPDSNTSNYLNSQDASVDNIRQNWAGNYSPDYQNAAQDYSINYPSTETNNYTFQDNQRSILPSQNDTFWSNTEIQPKTTDISTTNPYFYIGNSVEQDTTIPSPAPSSSYDIIVSKSEAQDAPYLPY